MELDDREFSDIHRFFLQGFMSRPLMTMDEAKQLLSDCSQLADRRDVVLSVLINDINFQLRRQADMEIKRGLHPVSGEECYTMVNMCDDEASKLSTAYSPAEVAFFKRLVELIVTDDDTDGPFLLSSTTALSQTSRIKPTMQKQEAEQFLKQLEVQHWIIDINGKLSLGLRTLLELGPYLRDTFEDSITECSSCLQILTNRVEICSNKDCDVLLHSFCAAKIFESAKNPRCYKCQSPWQETCSVRPKRKQLIQDDDSNDDDIPLQRQTRASIKKK